MLKSKFSKNKIEAGCDEAGRGCLAGPVFAAAVILPPRFRMKGLDDSKKLNLEQRLALREKIEKRALAWAVGSLDNHEIDEINILNASFKAMHRALDQLSLTPELILVDGNRFNPYREIAFECIVKGDSKFASIAAASILAKTYRDDFMEQMHEVHPQYDWQNNKGYPTPKHREGIRLYGPTPFHRRSFRLLPEAEQLEIDFGKANKPI